jgi:hypothetical protein
MHCFLSELSRRTLLSLPRRLHESLVTVEAAYGERKEGRFGRRNETVFPAGLIRGILHPRIAEPDVETTQSAL